MTELLPADQQGVRRASAMLRQGDLIAFGTETVYGLGADATNAAAVAAIFAAKRRPRFNPLICHYPGAASAFAHVRANDRARRLAEAFWPGPLTMVLPRAAGCPVALLASAGLDTLAVRVPGHPVALALLRLVGRPVAAPSANPSGAVSPTQAAHVMAGLGGRIAAVLDSGPAGVGVESTVVDLSGEQAVLLRQGGVTQESLQACIGPLVEGGHGAVRAPGMMASHYAPGLPVRLNADAVGATEALLAFGPPLPGARAVFQLSEGRDVNQAASRLFEGLRQLDASGAAAIAAMPVPEAGLGRAVNDRLRRAAAPRG